MTSDGALQIADRLVMPIRAHRGATIGLVATSLPDRPVEPTIVCGLPAARDHLICDESRPAIPRAAAVFVVFAPLDMVQLAALGLCAVTVPGLYPLSTHLARAARLSDQIVVCLPKGHIGEMMAVLAAHQYAGTLNPDSATVRALFLPAARTPDSFVRQIGVESFAGAGAERGGIAGLCAPCAAVTTE